MQKNFFDSVLTTSKYRKDTNERILWTENLNIIKILTLKKNELRQPSIQVYSSEKIIVSCLNGHLFIVLIDLRKNSPTFQKWEGFHLTPDNLTQITIPNGFAYGFCSLEDNTIIHIFSQNSLSQFKEFISYIDATLQIKWPIKLEEAIILPKENDGILTLEEIIKFYGKEFEQYDV